MHVADEHDHSLGTGKCMEMWILWWMMSWMRRQEEDGPYLVNATSIESDSNPVTLASD